MVRHETGCDSSCRDGRAKPGAAMALRFIQMFLPEGQTQDVTELLEGHDVLGVWRDANIGNKLVLHLLVPAEQTEPIMDEFEEQFGQTKGFHVVVFPIEAVLPRPKVESADAGTSPEDPTEESSNHPAGGGFRVSREELYNEVTESLGVDRVFLAMAALSAVVAALGLLRNDVAVIIGAMVIAPLLGPNVAMSLAVTLGDTSLLRRASLTNLAGVAAALAVAFLCGLLFTVDAESPAIASRTQVDLGHIALALGAGAAGTLAYTRGLAGAVIGVMVAVALMPPLVAFGLLLAEGKFSTAWGSLLLTVVNVISINLAGTATFLFQGVRPRSWWEADRAKRATRQALILWLALLAVLTLIILLTSDWSASPRP